MTDAVTAQFNAQCLGGDRGLLTAVTRAPYPPLFHASCGTRLLPRPFFVDEAQMRGFAADVRALFDLLVEVPQRLFGGDLGAYCDALGIPPAQAALMRRFGDAPPVPYGRADIYHDGTGFKLLEFNIGSELGGTDRAEIQRALLQVPEFADFAARHGLTYVHTGERVAAALRAAAAPVAGDAPPVVALLEADGGLSSYLHLVLSFQEMMRGLGIELLVGEVGQVSERGGRILLDGRPVDVVLRYFSTAQIARAPGAADAIAPILRAHEEGRVVLYTTFASSLYANKGCLALLSDDRGRAACTDAERELVDRVLPWTRALTAAQVERCRAERDQLIVKPRADFAGTGIHAGWEYDDREWARILGECADAGFVVQRRVVPRREPVVDPDTGEVADWKAAWDVFLTPDGYAGSHIRALPYGDGAVVGMGANPACRTTGPFLVPGAAGRAA
ncbi:hypothetical protein GCM10010124_13250 [Pilimelia terevasa]|uniref:Glutathionylspermidine synthase pre-ATP-grasp-like domain-containing protein n=1 Tax=Pilimelia terevasa TaxID=53372 RepID=A0A8J3BHR5_9ACTN|nr:hypothetical protein [Pilimelia terevasa]GGK22123.1 hypothetical protein GCM10010124_13250 [Pilimelia terevasa]